jgi:hypothetical protein
MNGVDGMTGFIIGLLVLCAVASWCVAAWSAISVVTLAPKGTGFSTYMNLGWWRHRKIAEAIGPAAEPHLARYRMAFYVFFGCVLAGIALSFLMIGAAQDGAGA